MDTVYIIEINGEPFKWFETKKAAEQYAKDNIVDYYFEKYKIYALDKADECE